MEVFRGLGLSDMIHAAGAHVLRIFTREYLVSCEQKEIMDPTSWLDTRALSPEPSWWYCPQSRLEPLFVAVARQRAPLFAKRLNWWASLRMSTASPPCSVNRMPEGTLKALADHGDISEIMSAYGGDCEAVLEQFAKAGVDLDALAARLQDEGAKSFVNS